MVDRHMKYLKQSYQCFSTIIVRKLKEPEYLLSKARYLIINIIFTKERSNLFAVASESDS